MVTECTTHDAFENSRSDTTKREHKQDSDSKTWKHMRKISASGQTVEKIDVSMH